MLTFNSSENWKLSPEISPFPRIGSGVVRISGETCQGWFCSVYCGVWLLCKRPRPLKQKCSPHRGHLPSLNTSSSLSPQEGVEPRGMPQLFQHLKLDWAFLDWGTELSFVAAVNLSFFSFFFFRMANLLLGFSYFRWKSHIYSGFLQLI